MTTYLWDFGDGTTSTVKNPTHTYTTPGTYTVVLTVDGVERVRKVDYITVSPPLSGFLRWNNTLEHTAAYETYTGLTVTPIGGTIDITFTPTFGEIRNDNLDLQPLGFEAASVVTTNAFNPKATPAGTAWEVKVLGDAIEPVQQVGLFSSLTPAILDPQWSNVKALCHFEGTVGTQTYTDSSTYNRTIVGNAQAKLAAHPHFGLTSLQVTGAVNVNFPFDATIGGSEWARMGTDTYPLTFEVTLQPDSVVGEKCLVGAGNQPRGAAFWWAFTLINGDIIRLCEGASTNTDLLLNNPIPAGVFTTIAIAMKGTANRTFGVWVNGVWQGEATSVGTPIITGSGSVDDRSLDLGRLDGGMQFLGYWDELRISEELFLPWATNYSVATAAFRETDPAPPVTPPFDPNADHGGNAVGCWYASSGMARDSLGTFSMAPYGVNDVIGFVWDGTDLQVFKNGVWEEFLTPYDSIGAPTFGFFPAPTFVSWILDGAIDEFPVSVPASYTDDNTYSWTGTEFTSLPSVVSTNSSSTQGVKFPGNYLRMDIVCQKTVTWLLPVLGFSDANGDGYTLSIISVGFDPAVSQLRLSKVVGGNGTMIAESNSFNPGTAVTEVRVVDNGTTCEFFVNGVLNSTGPSVITPAFPSAFVGQSLITSSNGETIISAAIYGEPV